VETYVRQSRLLEKGLEGRHAEVMEVQGFAALYLYTEDKAVILPEVPDLESFGFLGRLVGFERLDGPPRELYAAAPTILRRGKGRAGPRLGLGAPDVQGSSVKVHILLET
jgi:hypothetical protein